MAITIKTSRFSFYQFGAVDVLSGCGYDSFDRCLDVFAFDDVQFQFKLITSTKAEADLLCDLTNDHIEIGIADHCGDASFLKIFTEKTVRYRINDNTLLYNWYHGVPSFESFVAINKCFFIKIRVNGSDIFCSNCLKRIGESCYTAVLQYGNNDDAFDFDYCGGTLVGSSTDETCEPLFITFSGQSTLVIPYTASLIDKYGAIPTVVAWLDNGSGELVSAAIEISFDAFPPSLINFDFGGPASGVIKLS